MRKAYPSDISREQFAKIEGLLLGARKKTKPRQVDLYEVFCIALCAEKRLSMGYATERFAGEKYAVHLLQTMERKANGKRSKPAGAGFKKIRLARPASNMVGAHKPPF